MTSGPGNLDIPCAILRGGSSKGVFLERRHVPVERARQDHLLAALMGSPDVRQIDGLGGADPLTSKAVILNPSDEAGVDLDYESFEIAIADSAVNRDIACGNLVAATGHFAASTGMIALQHPVTRIRVRAISTGKLIEIELDTPLGDFAADGGMRIDGVPGSGTSVTLRFIDPAGTRFSGPTPLGPLIATRCNGTDIPVSVVDAGALHCFVSMQALGVDPEITPAQLDRDLALRRTLEEIRASTLATLNDLGTANRHLSAGSLKVTLVGPASAPGAALKAVVVNRERTHKSLPVSGTIALVVAANTAGTLVHALARRGTDDAIAIEHPGGVLQARYGVVDGDSARHYVALNRTARMIMRGVASMPLPA